MRRLVAEDGYVYTQANETNIKNKVFSKELYLGIKDSEDNWVQITEDEAELLLTEQNKIFDSEYERDN